jgi:hypothetical protein
LKAPDLREIIGVSTDAAERLSGVSGGAILYIIDEASAPSFTEAMFQALVGNTAGSGIVRIVMISNPTRATGSPFYLAFTDRKDFWHCIHVNTEDVALWCDARGVTIPGIANGARLRQWAEEYGGRDSPFYRVRVRGEFLLNEAGRAFPLDIITAAQLRHVDAPEDGVLHIGLDPAGPGLGGDETAFALVRGWKHVSTFTFSGLSEDATIEHLLALLRTHRKSIEVPQVMIDSEGPIGHSLTIRLRAIANGVLADKAFDVFGIRASGGAQREPQSYDRVRDELLANLRRWLDDGGAILSDHMLEQELHTIVWSQNVNGLLKATAKEDIREALHRSCDRLDALALAVWRHGRQAPSAEDQGAEPTTDYDIYGRGEASRTFDPYAGVGVFGRSGE